MTRYVAFLRAINVGGRRVPMDRLQAAFRIRGKFMDSQVKTKALDRALGQPTTTRSITMLRKLAAKLAS